ncbi:MAG: methyltransferase domain-containing protein [Opitutales bacterium]
MTSVSGPIAEAPIAPVVSTMENMLHTHMQWLKQSALSIFQLTLPLATRRRMLARLRGAPPPGGLDFGDLRRKTPISRTFGFDRGLPVDRYYIENFLSRHTGDIRGRVMEIKSNAYTRRFGEERVEVSDILDVDKHNREATIIADLTRADAVPANIFDCIILTQTLLLIYDVPAALQTCFRILKPGGVLLLTVPGISQMDYKALGHTWHWSFTQASMQRLLEENFGNRDLKVESQGNVLAATAQLHGIATEELTAGELDTQDPDYQVLITARVVKN